MGRDDKHPGGYYTATKSTGSGKYYKKVTERKAMPTRKLSNSPSTAGMRIMGPLNLLPTLRRENRIPSFKGVLVFA